MKIGIIGFSKYLRKVYWSYLQATPGVEIAAICDRSAATEILPFFAGHGMDSVPPIFTDYQLMIRTVALDAVVISTPHALHFEQALFCLQNGLHVYLDKPLACRFEEAAALVKIAGAHRLNISVGNQRRYEAPYLAAKNIIRHPGFGDIQFINYLFANSPWEDYGKIWRGDPVLSGGGTLMDIGYLAIDTLLWLIGKPVRQVFALSPDNGKLQVESTIALTARFAGDIVANLTISYDAPPASVQEELAIYGSKKSLFVRRFQPQKSTMPPLLTELSGNGQHQEYTFDNLPDNSTPLKDFITGIQNGTASRSDGASHLQTVEVIDSCYRSIQDQKLILLPGGA